MYNHPVNIPEELMDIKYSLSLMSYNNVKWTCLYSGMGIIHTFSEKDTKKILDNIELNTDTKDSLQNLVFLKCLYKKGKPQFSKPPEEIINPGSYMWDFGSFNKTILVSTQALGIASLCKFAEIIYPQNAAEGIIMINNAQIYYNFINTHLRSEDGLFVSAVDKTKSLSDELKIKLEEKNTKMLDQVLVHEAFLSLYYTTSNKKHPEYYNKHSDNYLSDTRRIFDFISNNINLAEMSTKNISLFVSSLARCCSIERDKEQVKKYISLIILLCAEAESRIKITGEVERSINSLDPASIVTHFLTASAFIEGYLVSDIMKFRDISLRILKYLDDFYNENTNLYTKGDCLKFSYSMKEIAEILKCLYLSYIVSKDENKLKHIKEFYITTVELSGIVQSIQKDKRFLGRDIKLSTGIPYTEECNKPPVFLKSYRVSMKKVITHKVSKSTNSLYSLYASYLFATYFFPQAKAENDSGEDNCENLKASEPNNIIQDGNEDNSLAYQEGNCVEVFSEEN